MPTISEPEIVFCENNHIYDKAIHNGCPYCRQIAKQTDKMKLQVESGQAKAWGFGRKKQDGDGNSTTMLSKKWRLNAKSKDPEATEFVAKGTLDEDATVLSSARMSTGDDEDATVLVSREIVEKNASSAGMEAGIIVPEQKLDQVIAIPLRSEPKVKAEMLQVNKAPMVVHVPQAPEGESEEAATIAQSMQMSVRRVIGWLVCIEGDTDYGKSFELTEGENFISINENGTLSCGQIPMKNNRMEVVFYRDNTTGIFQIQVLGDEAPVMNGAPISAKGPIQPYSRLGFPGVSVVFFPAVGACGFEWR